ncbi:MAG: alkyl hydroperoxide reductase [alpha proteobacterium QL1]|jgi:Peroxiredoxin|nr:MAG: alkyl hydroperoxide reductase [alpha proteobacterium QL1]
MIQENKKAPNFTLPSTSGKDFELKNNLKNHLVIYFYPKDNTPGCTTESVEFAKQYKTLQKLKTEVIGISKDSIDSHHKFIKEFKLPFLLLSDEHTKVLKLYDAWGEKSMYGKKFMGIKRTTVLIGSNGTILKIWNNVKVKDHVAEVVDTIKNLA